MKKPVCAIVGVGPGNGAAFARRFAREGYALALLARSQATTKDLAVELQDAKAYTVDSTDAQSIEAAFASIEGDLGAVSVLIYNAGSGDWWRRIGKKADKS
jgi:short-subunit dehydrogenase